MGPSRRPLSTATALGLALGARRWQRLAGGADGVVPPGNVCTHATARVVPPSPVTATAGGVAPPRGRSPGQAGCYWSPRGRVRPWPSVPHARCLPLKPIVWRCGLATSASLFSSSCLSVACRLSTRGTVYLSNGLLSAYRSRLLPPSCVQPPPLQPLCLEKVADQTLTPADAKHVPATQSRRQPRCQGGVRQKKRTDVFAQR